MLMTVLPLVVIFYYVYERLYRSRTEAFLQRDTALRAFAWQAAMGTIALGALLRATVPEANVVIRKSAAFTRGSPPTVSWAAVGWAVAATRAETQTASATRDRARRMVSELL